MLERFNRAVGALVRLGGIIAGTATVLILVLVCVEVVARLFNRSTMVADELAGYLNVAVIFFGLAYTLREGGFIRVELLYDKLTGSWRTAAKWFIVLSSLVFTAAITWFLALHVIYAYRYDTRAVSVLQTPEFLPQSMMIAGCLLVCLQLLAYVLDRVRRIP